MPSSLIHGMPPSLHSNPRLNRRRGEEEVLFSDVQSDTPIQKKGYDKILKCCQIALSEQYSYVWIGKVARVRRAVRVIYTLTSRHVLYR
jgi:hypothetical protein